MRWLAALLCCAAALAHAYPTDAFERTGIRRLVWQEQVNRGEKRGSKIPAGAQWPERSITLKLTEAGKDFRLTAETPKDPELQEKLVSLLKKLDYRDYGVALVDLTDPARPRYAGFRETWAQTPGSVAKVLVGAALFEQLRRRFPDDVEARQKLLRERLIAADAWAMPNSHEVPVIDAQGNAAIRRVKHGDVFSLWEWVDHMLSPSSNAAATMVWREAILMHLLGPEYPPASVDEALLSRWDKATFTTAAFAVLDEPLVAAGLDPQAFALRLFFTTGPSKYLSSQGSSVSALALVQWMVALEQGRIVDAWSSLELKKMLYLTRRRVRYAKARELADAALFFKSGSLYQCQPEEGFTCAQYQGNVINVLNALVEIEAPPLAVSQAATPAGTIDAAQVGADQGGAGLANVAEKSPNPASTQANSPSGTPAPTSVYIVGVLSNELKKNAADDHMKLAGALHRLLQGR